MNDKNYKRLIHQKYYYKKCLRKKLYRYASELANTCLIGNTYRLLLLLNFEIFCCCPKDVTEMSLEILRLNIRVIVEP